MDPAILKIVAQVAGVAGIALAVFLTLFRDVIRKQIFPMLTKQQAFRLLTLILVLVWSVALAGIGAWVWISSHNNPKVVADGAPNATSTPGVGAAAAPGSELVGEWLVTSAGALPETVNQELKKNAETSAGSPKKETGDGMEKAIDDLTKAFGGLAKAASQPGSFVIRLNADASYKISEKKGIFAESSSDGLLAPSGSWTYNRADNRLVLIPVGGGTAPAFTFKTMERDRLIVENSGGRMCVFERQR